MATFTPAAHAGLLHLDPSCRFYGQRLPASRCAGDSRLCGLPPGRQTALEQLAAAELDIIFSVDLFNEGTDLPAIDTVLMLRPTESRIVFLQQLGRGLRLYQGKERLVVIDLVGNHKACLYKPQLLQTQLTRPPTHANGAMPLAAGCFINLDPKLLPLLALLKSSRNRL